MDLTAGSTPKAGILLQISRTGLAFELTRRAASWGSVSGILTIGEILTVVMMVSKMLWPDYGHLYIIVQGVEPTTLLDIVADDVSVRDCRRYMPLVYDYRLAAYAPDINIYEQHLFFFGRYVSLERKV